VLHFAVPWGAGRVDSFMSGGRENRGDDQEFPLVSVENSRIIAALLRSLLRRQNFKELA
jgi:hypothetical protein